MEVDSASGGLLLFNPFTNQKQQVVFLDGESRGGWTELDDVWRSQVATPLARWFASPERAAQSATEITQALGAILTSIRNLFDEAVRQLEPPGRNDLAIVEASWKKLCRDALILDEEQALEVISKVVSYALVLYDHSTSSSVSLTCGGISTRTPLFGQNRSQTAQPQVDQKAMPRIFDLLHELAARFHLGEIVDAAIRRAVRSGTRQAVDGRLRRLFQHNPSETLASSPLFCRLIVTNVVVPFLESLPTATSKANVGCQQTELTSLAVRHWIDDVLGRIYSLAVLGWPSTRGLLLQLKAAMAQENGYGGERLAKDLRLDVQRRLLHSGRSTAEILTGYAAVVESTRLLDPSARLLWRVARPVRDYLRKRPDTVRQIIAYLTNESRATAAAGRTTDDQQQRRQTATQQHAAHRLRHLVHSRLSTGGGLGASGGGGGGTIGGRPNSNAMLIVDEDDLQGLNDEYLRAESELVEDWRAWRPPALQDHSIATNPLSAMDAFSSDGLFRTPNASRWMMAQAASSATSDTDVFNMFVSVYGSKDVFVKEYRQLLAERLIQQSESERSWEPHYLRLLKARFSDAELQGCEVMLKDVRESDKVDRLIAPHMTVPLLPRIASTHFWPPLCNENVELPPALEAGLDDFARHYADHKPDRTLKWMRAAGMVEIGVTIDGLSVQKVVPNTHAAVLYLFLEKEDWTLAEVAERLHVGRHVVKKRLEWWQTQGVLVSGSNDAWSLTKQPQSMDATKAYAEHDYDSDGEGAGDDEAAADAVDSLEQFWSYTRSFIDNQENKEVRAERMHTIYRMFQSPGAQPTQLQTVILFLQRKVKQGLLSFHNGLYRVVKENNG